MNKENGWSPNALKRWETITLLVAVWLFLGVTTAAAQAAAEYAGAVSAVSAAGASAKAPKKINFPATAKKKKGGFRHLPAGISESHEEFNQRALEEGAGEDAGKLLLRSQPSGARVWINGKLVGSTPLLLIVPPGGYEVEMRGKRMGVAQREVDVLPKEKREVVVPLASRYPASVRLQ